MPHPTQLVRLGAIVAALLITTCTSAGQDSEEATAMSVAGVAIELGLRPESIAACGLADDAYQMLERLRQEPQRREALQELRDRTTSLTDLVARLERAIDAVGEDSDVLVNRHNAAKVQLKEAVEGSIQIMADLFEQATLGVPRDALDRLNNWRRSRRFTVPDSLRVLPLSEDRWKDVVKALRAEGRATRRRETLDPAQAQLLSELRNRREVVEAKDRLRDKLIAVQEVFELF